MNISILYYDDSTPAQEVRASVEQIASTLNGNDYRVIALPKNFDLLLHCSVDQLLSVRALIDMALTTMIQSGTMDNPVQVDVQDRAEDKIIDISKYLS